MKGNAVVCPHCGKAFFAAEDNNYLYRFRDHLEGVHDDHRLEEVREDESMSGRLTKDVIRQSDFELKDASELNLREQKSEDKESKNENETKSWKNDLARKMIKSESPNHGIRREKQTQKENENQLIEKNKDQSREVESAEKSSFDIKELLPSSSGLKKWGGGALIVGALAFAGFTAYQNLNRLRQVDDTARKDQEKSSASIEQETETKTEKSPESKDSLQVEGDKGNGHKSSKPTGYRTYDQL